MILLILPMYRNVSEHAARETERDDCSRVWYADDDDDDDNGATATTRKKCYLLTPRARVRVSSALLVYRYR